MSDPAVMRRVLDWIAFANDGKPAASTVGRKRAVFHNALEYAVELGYLPSNPLSRVRWTAPKLAEAVDRRVVVNPEQAEALLRAVAEHGRRSGAAPPSPQRRDRPDHADRRPAEFDGHGAGWLASGADSAHPPTLSGGRARVLYLLPQGAIEFTPS